MEREGWTDYQAVKTFGRDVFLSRSRSLIPAPLPVFHDLFRLRYGKEMEGVDPSCREQYLDDKEFVEVFGMSKSEFASQPKWKQLSQKKAKELF